MRKGPTTSITRVFTFDAGHRVFGHEGKCRHLHGHTYKAEVTVQYQDGDPGKLDALGRVIDFSVLKSVLGKWIEDNWDHNLLLNTQDPLYAAYLSSPGHLTNDQVSDLFMGREPYWFVRKNPTAENIARELFLKTEELLGYANIHPVHVRIWETPNCFADYSESKEVE